MLTSGIDFIMTNQSPQAIFFDLDETLIENVIPVPELFARMYFDFEDRLGAGQKDAFFTGLRSNAAALWGTMFERNESPEMQLIWCFAESVNSLQVMSKADSEELGNEMFKRFVHLSSNNTRLHTGALETLGSLRANGFTTGIITNGIEQLQLGKIHRLALQDHVDHVVVSAQARAHKPARPVFELALTRAGVDSHQAWQIGDHATNDVAGAIRAGMSGIFFDPNKNRSETAFADLEEKPTHVIHALPEVLELVSVR
jgi:putative hydrolase of the HAD superfamily